MSATSSFPQGTFKSTFEWSGKGPLTLSTLRNIMHQVDDLPNDSAVVVSQTDDQRDGKWVHLTITYTGTRQPPTKPPVITYPEGVRLQHPDTSHGSWKG